MIDSVLVPVANSHYERSAYLHPLLRAGVWTVYSAHCRQIGHSVCKIRRNGVITLSH
jgi:hypothetical protein